MQIKAIKHIMQDNDVVAAQIRKKLKDANVLAVNLISSPGSGKTTLLEKSITDLNALGKRCAVIVGDLATARDAERLDQMAAESIQINTGLSCHLYANQIAAALEDLNLDNIDILFIENVGNMVCPGEFDLGENIKTILYSFPEGDDKVAKYPTIFRVADIVLLTKVDIKSACDFNMDRVMTDIRKLNSVVPVMEISSRAGTNFQRWIDWMVEQTQDQIGRQAGFVTE